VADPQVVALLLAVAAADGEAPARRLPPVTTVCRDVRAHTCWTEAGESRCPTGEVFRIVIAGPGRTDVATALDDCRKPSGSQ
jgi:hypothetical protein